MYIIYKKIDSIRQLMEIEDEGGFDLMKATGHVYNFFIGMYFRSDVVIALPKGRKKKKEIEAQTFGFENRKLILFFTKIKIVGTVGYREENVKTFNKI